MHSETILKSGSPIRPVIDNDLCIGCGACIEACPPKIILPTYNTYNGANEVLLTTEDHCAACSAPCEKVCPSISVDFELMTGESSIQRDGRILEIYTGYAPAHRFNGTSSSGAVLRLLVADALEHGTPVICLASTSQTGPGDYNASLLTTLQDLERVPGSIYHSVSFDAALPLLRAAEKPCLVVGIPCHLEGLQQYINLYEKELSEKIALIAGIICGWMYSHHGIRAFSSYKNINQEIKDVRYRGEDKVGKLKIFTNDEVHTFDRRKFHSFKEILDYRASFSTDVNRLRCRLCQNHLNVTADIAVGDAWLARKGGEKLSIVIVRTAKGLDRINALAENNSLVLEQGSFDDVIESQSRNLVEGITARKLARFLHFRGTKAPEFLYADGVHELEYGFSEKIQFNIEVLKRKILRSGNYSYYRLFYFLTRFKEIGKAYVRNILLGKGRG